MTDYVPGRGTLWLQNKAREEAPVVVSTPKKTRAKVKATEPEASPEEKAEDDVVGSAASAE